MRRISTALALVLVAGAALSLGGVAAGSGSGSGGKTTYAVMSVTGSAPKGAKVTWWTFRSGGTRTGKFPFHLKMQAFDAQYQYFVKGQLKHGGKITCKLTIGTSTKVSHAKGGHKACLATLTSDNNGGWH